MIEFLNITDNDLALLLFDGHSSHTKYVPDIDAARENRIILLCFSLHCSYKIQLCNVSFTKPLNTYQIKKVRKF